MRALLAHQGGWDEILLVAAPLSLFAGLLYLANRRADRLVQSRHQEPDPEDGTSAGGDAEDR
jgi:hypothetical protein